MASVLILHTNTFKCKYAGTVFICFAFNVEILPNVLPDLLCLILHDRNSLPNFANCLTSGCCLFWSVLYNLYDIYICIALSVIYVLPTWPRDMRGVGEGRGLCCGQFFKDLCSILCSTVCPHTHVANHLAWQKLQCTILKLCNSMRCKFNTAVETIFADVNPTGSPCWINAAGWWVYFVDIV